MSQPTPDEPVLPPDSDPLLEFCAEPEAEPVAAAAAPADDPVEPVANAEVAVPPVAVPVEARPDPELQRRFDRTERMLEKALIEISTLKSDVATLVTAIDDIKKRQSRPVERVPATPAKLPPPRMSRAAAAAMTAIGVLLVVVLWSQWSGSYEMPELEEEVGAAIAPADVAPSDVAAAGVAPSPIALASTSPVEIQNAAAVSIVEPARDEPPPAPRPRNDSIGREPDSGVTEYFGTLSIDASPAGEVFINRKSVGRTPMRMERLRAGSHLVWIERDGFRRWTRVVSVGANRVSRVSAELDPLR